jgi:hypothetical protein
LFHLTIAIARFFEFLLLDIARSIAGLAALGLIGLVVCVAGVLGIYKLGRKIGKRQG